MKLSGTQIAIIQHLASGDEPMAYFKGGFWTLPSLGNHAMSRRAPEHAHGDWHNVWYVTLQSLRALAKLGLLARLPTATNYDAFHYPGLTDFVLTEQGLEVARAL